MRGEITLHGVERIRGLAGEQADRRFIAVDPIADEIMIAEIADIELQPRDDIVGIDEARMTRGIGDGAG
jgi:hypothetical protein